MGHFDINDEAVIPELKNLLIKLAYEKDLADKKILELADALEIFFPFDLHTALNESENRGTPIEFSRILQDPDFSEKLKINELAPIFKENNYNLLAMINALKYFKNLYSQCYLSKENNDRTLSFRHTIGSKISIEKNQDHCFAKKHTLIHLKSNSICTWIPKVGCSNIRYSVAKANGAISNLDDISWIHSNNNSFCTDNKELLKASYTYVFLRNPFKRLLSFFIDKMCHKDPNETDKSYSAAQKKFNASDSSSFEDFVKLLWLNPRIIHDDIHTKPQNDFLVYNKYDNYFCMENYKHAAEMIFKKTGLEIIDTRSEGSIHTTHNLKESENIQHNTTTLHIKEFLENGKKPVITNMFTKEMCHIVGTLYMNDIQVYLREVENAESEMRYWITKITH